VPYFGSRHRARRRCKNSKAWRSTKLNAVVMTFAARHRRKSDRCLKCVPEAERQIQVIQELRPVRLMVRLENSTACARASI